jgi:hypothetical protein
VLRRGGIGRCCASIARPCVCTSRSPVAPASSAPPPPPRRLAPPVAIRAAQHSESVGRGVGGPWRCAQCTALQRGCRQRLGQRRAGSCGPAFRQGLAVHRVPASSRWPSTYWGIWHAAEVLAAAAWAGAGRLAACTPRPRGRADPRLANPHENRGGGRPARRRRGAGAEGAGGV